MINRSGTISSPLRHPPAPASSPLSNSPPAKNYSALIGDIGSILSSSRQQAFAAVNSALVQAYWKIGQRIVEFEQGGKEKAEYGSELLDRLQHDLTLRYGRGFNATNIAYMRLVYINYPIMGTLSPQLSWSHYIELLKVEDDLPRGFYEKQCISEGWSVRQLKRQKESMLFERLALSKDVKKIMALSKQGHILQSADDLPRDPYVLEFLGIDEKSAYTEADLEARILSNLQMFLLELGKGFAFVGRQYRITLDNHHYRVDLVFYNHILKCFVLLDLKSGPVSHADVGQMNMYLNYFKSEVMGSGDNLPVGIILATEKERLLVKYALGGISNKLFVSRYKLCLPDQKLLEEKVRQAMEADASKPAGLSAIGQEPSEYKKIKGEKHK